MIEPVNTQAFKDLISGKQQGPAPALARFALRCLSPIYATAVRLRNASYDYRIYEPHRPTVPVISVGNITAGGTGKTPTVALIANWLSDRGEKPCLLSRGYHAADVETGNDEKLLLDRLCPNVPHLQDPDRSASSTIAEQQHAATVLVLDDGFQHRQLARDLNVVLIDATDPFGMGFVLPRGLLREPTSGLKRADLFVITRCDQVATTALDEVRRQLEPFGKPVVEVAFKPSCLVDAVGNTSSLDDLPTAAAAFCGIGNPDAFRATLASIGVEPSFFHAFPDHCHYAPSHRRQLSQLAAKHDATTLICTEKDIVKLADFGEVNVRAIRIEAVIVEGRQALETALQGVIDQADTRRTSIECNQPPAH